MSPSGAQAGFFALIAAPLFLGAFFVTRRLAAR